MLEELFSVTIKQDIVLFELCANERGEKSLDVHVLKDDNYVQIEELNQGVTCACNIGHASFGKENSKCINTWKEEETYADGRGHEGCHLFGSVNKINERDLFLFLPPPRKEEVSQRCKSQRLVRDLLSLKDTGWGPPLILFGCKFRIYRDVKGSLNKQEFFLRELVFPLTIKLEGVRYTTIKSSP